MNTVPDTEAGAESELLDLEAAARRLYVSKTTLYRMLDRGEIRGVKVGRQWRFREADLQAYLARGPVATALSAVPVEMIGGEIAALAAQLPAEEEVPPAPEADGVQEWENRLLHLLAVLVRLAQVRGAAAVHLEPTAIEGERAALIRLRVDGALQELRRVPPRLLEALVMRLRLLTGGDPAADGYLEAGLHLDLGADATVLRVSILPALSGDAAVLQLAPQQGAGARALEDYGLHPDDLPLVRGWLEAPGGGAVIAVGPAGSGRTALLYKLLESVATAERKCVSVERISEGDVPGVLPLEVNERTRTMAAALRALLRHDVDAVLVGELQDLESVDLTLHLAANGTFALFPLHATSAAEGLLRVVEVFPQPQQARVRLLLAGNVRGLISMRLVRRLCPQCRKRAGARDAALGLLVEAARRQATDLSEGLTAYHAVGCPACGGSGYRGRTGLYEAVAVGAPAREALLQGAGAERLAAALAPAHTLAAEAIREASQGIISLEEALQVIG